MKIVIDITPEEIHSFMKKEPCMQGSDNEKNRNETCLALLLQLLFKKGFLSDAEINEVIQGNVTDAIGLGIKSWLEKNYMSPSMKQQLIKREP